MVKEMFILGCSEERQAVMHLYVMWCQCGALGWNIRHSDWGAVGVVGESLLVFNLYQVTTFC